MYLDGRTVTLSNVPRWREQLGVSDAATIAALQAQVADLQASLSVALLAIQTLDSELDALADRVAALEGNPTATLPSLDVVTIDGVNLLDYAERPVRDWQNVILESPETGKLYRLQPIQTPGGVTNFDLVEADTLQASDGRRWRLVVQLVDGLPNLADPELIT